MKLFTEISIKLLFLSLVLFVAPNVDAATLKLNPNTGVYTVNTPFSVAVVLNTEGKSVNAADGTITFNPNELQVVAVSRTSSIFNLWTEEPAFSNSAGTVTFGGGSPTGYKGTSGNIVTISFRPLAAGTPKVSFKSGSILAADGLGTNVLTSMGGSTYTIVAKSDQPAPEYVPPANTPAAPKVTSKTHSDESQWYRETTAVLTWTIPSGVTAIRTLLDESESTVPTIVYDELITEKTISDLPQGISYFHIQFKNADGWGRITHYKLGVDTEAPKDFTIVEEPQTEEYPQRVLKFELTDTSPILEYKIQIDGKDPIVFKDEKFERRYTLEPLTPGYHTLTVEAFDSAGNTAISSYSLTVEAFEKPVFIEYPTRINTEVIPAIKGKTRPGALVAVRIVRAGDGAIVSIAEGSDPFTVTSNGEGEFTYVPDESFERGVYIITATAKDSFGRISEESDEIRIIVEAPGYVVLGMLVINALSVIVPLFALVILLIFGTWYLWHQLSRWKKKVRKETLEAEAKLTLEFRTLIQNINAKIDSLKESRKGKLTKAELELIGHMESDLDSARKRIAKEIEDIEDIIT